MPKCSIDHSLWDLTPGSKIDRKQYLITARGPGSQQTVFEGDFEKAEDFLEGIIRFKNLIKGIQNISELQPYDLNDPLAVNLHDTPSGATRNIPGDKCGGNHRPEMFSQLPRHSARRLSIGRSCSASVR